MLRIRSHGKRIAESAICSARRCWMIAIETTAASALWGKLKMLREIWLISGTCSEKAHMVSRLSDEDTSDIRREDGRKQGTRSTGDNRLSKHLAKMLQAFG